MRFRFMLRTAQRWCLQQNVLLTAICCVIALHLSLELHTPVQANESPAPLPSASSTQPFLDLLPEAQVHSLPSPLSQWQPDETEGDYFTAIQPTDLGYLVWSTFPVRVYLDPVIAPEATNAASNSLIQAWIEAVQGAIAEWNTYLPLETVDTADHADIVVSRRTPPLEIRPGQPVRSRSAETRYEFYVDSQSHPYSLKHRFQIFLRSDQSREYVQAAARHELGHALGIWGHSSLETDALYFSQVRSPAPISVRDVNTLQKIYQQPTRLGWEFPSATID